MALHKSIQKITEVAGSKKKSLEGILSRDQRCHYTLVKMQFPSDTVCALLQQVREYMTP